MNPSPEIIISVETARAEAQPWATPRPLSHPAPPSLDLTKAIPAPLGCFRDFCEAMAEAIQVPPDMVPPLALALASIGTARALEIELKPDWRETAPLWFAVLAPPGERKSALLGRLASPVHEWQAGERERLKGPLAQYAERRRTKEAQLAGARAKAAHAKDPAQVESLERDARDLADAHAKLPALDAPELVTSNATPEAVRDLLARNGEKCALVSAEVDAGQLLGSRYSKSGTANLDLFLAAFTGDPAPAHRIGRDIPLARPALVLALCVQPEAVADVLGDRVARGRGFVDRLCLIMPETRMGTRALDSVSLPSHLWEWWRETLRRLLDLPWPGRVTTTAEGVARCPHGPHVMGLSDGARTVFDVLRADVESRIGEGGDLHPVCGFASKLPGVIARIALALEAMQNPAAPTVSAETMRAAVEWGPFLLAHFRAVLGDAAEGEEVKLARRLLRAVQRRKLADLSAKDAFDLLDGPTCRTMADLIPVLDLLLDAEWLRPLPPPPTPPHRPPSPRFAVNPAALAP
jgi:hypothetical protein